jgi:hypothetical protein
MKPEKQQLIQDLLGDESRRDATLLAGGRILRRRRHWRAATRGLTLALVATAVVLSLEQKKSHRAPAAELRVVQRERHHVRVFRQDGVDGAPQVADALCRE